MKKIPNLLAVSLVCACPTVGAFAYASPNLGANSASADQPIAWLGASNSSVYGMIYEAQFANLLTPRDAAAFLLDYGPKEFRMGLTWAHVIDARQRFKLSAEHFAEDSTYDFYSGQDHEFIGQDQVGAEYEYATLLPWLNSLVFNGYYVATNDGDFGNQSFTTAAGTFTNVRDLTGGSGGGAGIGPTWQPWSGGRLEVLANYDTINYDTNYEPAKSKSGIGATVDFTQQLSPHFALELFAAPRSTYQQYSASLTWTIHHSAQSQYGISLQASHIDSNTFIASDDTVLGLNFFYQWDAHKRNPLTPLCFAGDASCDALGWSTRSAAYMPGIYVERDQTAF